MCCVSLQLATVAQLLTAAKHVTSVADADSVLSGMHALETSGLPQPLVAILKTPAIAKSSQVLAAHTATAIVEDSQA